MILEFFIQTSPLTTDMPPDNIQRAEAHSITAYLCCSIKIHGALLSQGNKCLKALKQLVANICMN